MKPTTRLDWTRLLAVAFALIALAGQNSLIGGFTGYAEWDIGSRLALLLLAVLFVATYIRGRAWVWEPIVVPLLCIAGGTALRDPLSIMGLVIPSLLVASLFGSLKAWALRSVLVIATVPIVLIYSPVKVEHGFAADATTIGGLLPQLCLITVISRAIYSALRDQLQSAARDRIIGRAGENLLAARDVDEVHDVAAAAARDLLATTPDTALLMAVRGDDGIRIVQAAGLALPGRVMPPALLTDPGSVVPGFKAWHVEEDGEGRFLLLAGRRKIPASLIEVFRTLSSQVSLGEASRMSHAELDRRANHDHLTQLPNRAKFFTELARAVDHGAPGTVALLNVDLDDFKQVNDTYGHGAGDELLVQVASRLEEVADGHGLAARFGGDEFALLLNDMSGPAEAEQIAQVLCARLIEPLRLSAATVTVGASIGVAVHEVGVRASELTRRADIAMYSAKAHGKSRVQVFAAEQHGEVAKHRTLEDQLPSAIERGELFVEAQAYADLHTGSWVGVEALFQWRHPQLGTIEGRELLGIAERIGSLHEMTRHVLNVIASDMGDLPHLPIGLNLGARQLLDPGLAETVLTTLAANGMPPERLVLEVVEAEQLDDPVARNQLVRLADAGVRIALDDFGAGYVSLSALKAFPIHQLKIDATFLDGDPAALDLVLSVGQLLGTETIVQGVTSAEQMERLRTTTATAVQGPYISPTVPASRVAAALAV